MAEVLVATAIVGALVTASLDAAGMVFRMRKLNASPLTGPGYAQELLDEILAMPYEDPQSPGASLGPETGESGANRTAFDDVDDYHGWNSNDGRAKSGAALAGFTGWRRQASVAWVQLANPATTSGSETGLKSVTVTVTSPSGKVIVAKGLRSRYGALEQKTCTNTTAVTLLNVELKVGSAPSVERWSGRPSNHAAVAN